MMSDRSGISFESVQTSLDGEPTTTIDVNNNKDLNLNRHVAYVKSNQAEKSSTKIVLYNGDLDVNMSNNINISHVGLGFKRLRGNDTYLI